MHPSNFQFREEPHDINIPWIDSRQVPEVGFGLDRTLIPSGVAHNRCVLPSAQGPVPLDTQPLEQHPANHSFRDAATGLDVPWVDSSVVPNVGLDNCAVLFYDP